MPNPSGRIDNSAIESMCSILLSLTSLYRELDPKKHPRMCIIFNNISKNKSENELTSDQYIQKYKELLVGLIEKQYEKLDNQFIVERIDELFPEENFYFYQIRSDKDETIKE